jgi:hypothetical protein
MHQLVKTEKSRNSIFITYVNSLIHLNVHLHSKYQILSLERK